MGNTKAGYVAILGRPNSGKSTLHNALLDYKLSIVTPKAQTTRKRVAGIYSTEDTQIVFLDTPGIIKPDDEIHKSMMTYVQNSVEEADVLVILIDASKYDIGKGFDKMISAYISSFNGPKILLLNKIDKFEDKKKLLPLMSFMQKENAFDEIVPISALKNDNLKLLLDLICKYLPENPFYYDPEQISTESQRFFVSEFIREQVFFRFKEEVPYSVEVNVLEFKERENGKWYISAEIIVERDSQKKIIIGKSGEKIKELGTYSRKEIENHLGLEIFLELFVKVREDWRNNTTLLKSYGY